jgi:hypothetical protein
MSKSIPSKSVPSKSYDPEAYTLLNLKVIREGEIFEMTPTVQMKYIGATARCFSDAVDIFRFIHHSTHRPFIATFDMNKLHSNPQKRHKQIPEEDELFAQMLHDMLEQHGYTINKFGFKLDDDGNVKDHESLYINLKQ